jgi:hypothetical protein
MFALSRPGGEEKIASAIRQAGGVPLMVSKAERGVEVWEEC